MLGTSASVAQFNQRLRRIESNMQDDTTPEIPLTREIPLTQGKVAIIDSSDAPRVLVHKWCAAYGRNGKWYAKATIKQRAVLLHRFLLDALTGIEVDHENGDGLDCRRSNLRKATRAQNNQNHPVRRTSKTGLKGVTFCPKNRNPWRVRVEANGKRFNVGLYPTAEAAAQAYNAKAKEIHGEFARLNLQEVDDDG